MGGRPPALEPIFVSFVAELSITGERHTRPAPKRNCLSVSGGLGHFDGSNAVGFGAMGRVPKNVYLTGGFGAGLRQGTVGGRGGFMFAW